jgi:hypothetical protein
MVVGEATHRRQQQQMHTRQGRGRWESASTSSAHQREPELPAEVIARSCDGRRSHTQQATADALGAL